MAFLADCRSMREGGAGALRRCQGQTRNQLILNAREVCAYGTYLSLIKTTDGVILWRESGGWVSPTVWRKYLTS
jgi:hypothetical protein